MTENNTNTGGGREKRIGILRRTAKEVRTYNVRMKIMAALLGALLLLAIILYIIAALYRNSGSFTVKVDKIHMTKYGFALSESRNMTYQSSHLNAKIDKDMTNIAKEWLPDNLDQIDGEHNGDNYIAYTFYLKNAGTDEITYSSQIDIHAVTKAADNAVRVMVIKNGEETVYAKAQKGSNEPEPDTVAFLSNTQVFKNTTEGFGSGAVDKYTVVIWLEGNDPECIDDIRGGVVKMSMNFKVLEKD